MSRLCRGVVVVVARCAEPKASSYDADPSTSDCHFDQMKLFVLVVHLFAEERTSRLCCSTEGRSNLDRTSFD